MCSDKLPLSSRVASLAVALLASYQIRKTAGAHAPGMPGTFSPPPRVSDPDMHHGMCVTHVPWCMSGSQTCGLLWSRWRGKRSRHSRRMRTTCTFTYMVRGPMVRAVSLNGVIKIDRYQFNPNKPHENASSYLPEKFCSCVLRQMIQ